MRRQPRSTLFPYTTLFRSKGAYSARLPWPGRRGLFLIGNWMDHHTRTHGQQSFDHDTVSGLQSLFDQPGIADARAGLHRTGFDLVPGAHDEDALYALVLLHGALRHQNHAGAMLGNVADAPELAGE